MATLSFETLNFVEQEDTIRVDFLRMFSFEVGKDALSDIGDYELDKNSISFPDLPEHKAETKFGFLLEKGFKHLKNRMTNKPTVYVHRGSGIPLMGHVAFGIVDRGSNIVELRPMTSCNIKCVYCSVDEDRRPVDFVVEAEYLVEEFRKLADYKGDVELEAHIGTQGEPTLYQDFIPLVKGLASIPQVKHIVTDTNGTLLTPEKIDAMVEAGFTRFNLSINAMDPDVARKIAGAAYNIEHIKNIAKYIATKCDMYISPTYIPGMNDEEIPKIIEFAKSLKSPTYEPKFGIQNFLEYRYGRNPVKQMPWENFYKKIDEWEKQTGAKLKLSEEDFGIVPTKELPKPFKKGDIVVANTVCRGRLKGEMIAVAENRCILIPHCDKEGRVKLRIVKTKHNIFMGELVNK